MRIIYMGTPKFSADILKGLMKDSIVDVLAVFTKADAIRGRGNKLIPSDVKILAIQSGIPVYSPKTLKDNKVYSLIHNLHPDFICVAAYGMILPVDILSIPKYECLNVHGSLLPRWRGAAPVQRSILAGDKQIGVSIMRMESGMDTGDYCLQYPFDPSDMTLDEIFFKMSGDGAKGLICAMKQIIAGNIEWTCQDESKVVYADKIDKRELYLSQDDTVELAKNKVLASDSAHPCKCCIANKKLAITKAKISNSNEICCSSNAYEMIFSNKRLFLGFSDGWLELLEVKPDGKNIMEAKNFAQGIQNIKSSKLKWGIIQ